MQRSSRTTIKQINFKIKIEKLVYLCFVDYLCDTGKKLFTDSIYAFKYGPVVDVEYYLRQMEQKK